MSRNGSDTPKREVKTGADETTATGRPVRVRQPVNQYGEQRSWADINLNGRGEGELETPEIPDVPLPQDQDAAVPLHQGTPTGPAEQGTPEAAQTARRASPKERIPPAPAQYPPGTRACRPHQTPKA